MRYTRGKIYTRCNYKILLFGILLLLGGPHGASAEESATIEWVRQFGSVDPSFDIAQAIDSDGNAYVVGTVDGVLPGETSSGGNDAFIRKYDSSGNALWTDQFGTANFDGGFTVSVASDGVYVGGITNGDLASTGAGFSDAYLRKYDLSGGLLWTKQFGTDDADDLRGISISGSDVYVTGATHGTLPGETSSGQKDSYIQKYNSSGTLLWTRQYGSSGLDEAYGVSADESGVYVGGSVGTTLPGETSQGGADAYLRKYDTSGNIVWTKQFGSPDFDEIFIVALTGTSTLYAGGYTLGSFPGESSAGDFDSFVVQYDTDGNENWTRQFGVSGFDGIFGLTADETGVYVSGNVDGAFPGETFAGGFGDAFVRKYDSMGNILWTDEFGSNLFDDSLGLSVYETDLYVAGYTEGSIFGQTSSGDYDIYLLKMVQDTDHDGIFNAVDSDQTTFSNDFSDGTTTGSIISRGDQTLALRDAALFDEGITASANTGGGITPATIGACVASTFFLDPGEAVNITCGSVTAKVLSGNVSFEFTDAEGTLTTSTISTGNTLTFIPESATFTASPTNIGTISLVVGGAPTTLAPGASETFIENVAPIINSLTAPLDPQDIVSLISLSADFSDTNLDDTHIALWDFGDGEICDSSIDLDCSLTFLSGSGTTLSTHSYSTSGVYTITLTITDALGGSDGALHEFVVIYDPNGGYVTGGGWITSPTGAYVADPTLTGKANFGFVSKYQQGAQVPEGETSLVFKIADLHFHSTDYQWLVVAGHKAKYKGDGTINGAGNYGFMLTGTDGALNGGNPDTFRLKIWDKDNNDEIVYDNELGEDDDEDPTTVIGGGNIKIHQI